MIDLDFEPDGNGGLTTEGWCKADLEAGDYQTMWLGNAVVDALCTDKPELYLRMILERINCDPNTKIMALIHTVVGLARSERAVLEDLTVCPGCRATHAPTMITESAIICPRCNG